MTSRDFCYWLQGFFELRPDPAKELTREQATIIQNHLALVFKHEIDPSQGSPEHQAELQKLHDGTSNEVSALAARVKALESRPMPFDRDTPIRC